MRLAPDVIVPDFDPEAHCFCVDGRAVPGVTAVLKAAGIGHSDTTDSGYEIREEVMEAARERGADAHYACQLLDEGDLDWDSLEDDVLPRVEAYARWLEDSGFVADAIEQPLYHKEFDYAGIPDRAGWIGEQRVVVDLKPAGAAKPWHQIQLAAYAAFFKEGEWPERIVLELGCDTKKGYRERHFSPASAEWDWEVFQAALTIHTFKVLAETKPRARRRAA